MRGGSGLGDCDPAVDGVRRHFAGNRPNINAAVHRGYSQIDALRQLQPHIVTHPSAIPPPSATFLVVLDANRQTIWRVLDDDGLSLHRRGVRGFYSDIDLGAVAVPGVNINVAG